MKFIKQFKRSCLLLAASLLVLVGVLGWRHPARAYTASEFPLNVPGKILTYASFNFAGNPGQHFIKVFNSAGSVSRTYNLDSNFNPGEMVVLGSYLWVADTNSADSGKLAKIDIASSAVTYYTVGSPAAQVLRSIATDGTYIYVAGTVDRPTPQPDDERVYKVDQNGATLSNADEGGVFCSGQPCEIDTNILLIYENSILGQPVVWSAFKESAGSTNTNNLVAYRTSDLAKVKNCQIGGGQPNGPTWETAALNGSYFDLIGTDDIILRYNPNTCASYSSSTQSGIGTGMAVAANSSNATSYFLISNSGVRLQRWTGLNFSQVLADSSRLNPLDMDRTGNIFFITLGNGNLLRYDFTNEASLAITNGPTASPINSHNATINWATNESPTSQTTSTVSYGLTAAYGTNVANNQQNNHSVFIGGTQQPWLTPNTTYHYQVTTCNGFACVSSNDNTFTTTALQPPTITITDPIMNEKIMATGASTNVPIQGTATDTDGTVVNVYVRWCPGTGCTTQTWRTATQNLPNWWWTNFNFGLGQWRMEARAVDNDSLEATAFVLFSIQTRPVVNITSHTDGQTVNNANITLAGNATDADDNINSMTVSLNGGAPQPISISASQNVSWSKALTLNQGANTVNVVATDAAGNTGNRQITINYTLQQPPVVDITSHNDGDRVTTSSIAIRGTATDADNNIKTPMRVIVNGVSQNLTITQGQNVNWGPQTRTLNPGANIIRVEADDVSSPSNTGFDQITVWYNVPDFTFDLTSTSPLTVQQGTNGAFTFTLTSINGFNASVDLSIQSSSPAIPASYMTWSTDPVPNGWTSPATSNLAIQTSNLVAQTYTVTARATSGSLVKSAVATLIVTDGPDFSLTTVTASRTILPGGSGAYDLRLTETVPVYNENITMSIQSISPSPWPAGSLTTEFVFNPIKPMPYGTGRPFLNVTTTASLNPNTYIIQVKAHGDLLNRDRFVSVTLVVSQPDFALDAYKQGDPGTEAISVQYTAVPGNYAIWDVKLDSVNNWGGDVDLSFNQPASLGGRSLIDPDPAALPAGGSATPQYKVHYSGLSTGTYSNITINGNTGGATPAHSDAGLSLQVTAGPDYQLSAIPAIQNGTAGGSAPYTLNLTETTPTYNFPVNLTLDSVTAPAGGNASHITTTTLPTPATPAPTPGTNQAVTIDINSATVAGNYILRFKGVGTDPQTMTHFASATLVVGAAPDFALTALPATQIGSLGSSVQYTLNLKDLPDDSDVDYTGAVALTLDSVQNASGQPEPTIALGSLATPQQVTEDPGTNDVATINIGGTTPSGTYTLTFKGAGTVPLAREHTVQVELVINAAAFELLINPGLITGTIPGAVQYTLMIKDVPDDTVVNYTWPVDLTLDSVVNEATGQPGNGITLQGITTPQNPTEDPWTASNINIGIAAGTTQAVYDLTFKGVGRDPSNFTDTEIVRLNLTAPIAPVVSNINCVPGLTSIQVTWQTDIAATGKLYYSTVSPPQNIINESGSIKTNHLVTATNLFQDTDYYYQVESCDVSQTACSGRQPPAPLVCRTLSDAEPPVVQWVTPQDGDNISGSVDLKASATDNVAVDRVQFLVDGNAISTDQTPPDCPPLYCQTSWNTASVPDGNHTLTALAFDTAGNQASDSIDVTILNNVTPPVCSGLNYTAGSTTAQVWWTTDLPSDSRVYYCPETGANACGSCPGGYLGYYCQSKIINQSVTSHNVQLTGLTTNLYYHFTAVSCDGETNCGQCRR